jgi:hypothetical protein
MIFATELITIELRGGTPAIVSTKVFYSTTMKTLNWIFQPLTAIALSMLVMLNAIFYFTWFQTGYDKLKQAHQQLGNSLVKHLAFETIAPLSSEDRVVLSNLLNRFADEPFVLMASINAETDNGLHLSSSTKQQSVEQGDEFQFPIHFSNELLGTAHLVLSRDRLTLWYSQAISSWVIFNLISLASLTAFIYLKTHVHERQWHKLDQQLSQQLPEIASQLSGTAEQKLTQLMNLLNRPITRQGELMKQIQTQVADGDTERLIEQIALVSNEGSYQEIALVSIQCQNWDELIRSYPANELQTLWSHYESAMMRVSELYSGIVLPDGFTLVFGLVDDDEFVFNSICAARVIQLALQQYAARSSAAKPVFGIAISSGPAFVSKTHKHGIPLPLVTGDAEVWLSQLRALQPTDQIIMAEPVLQDEHANKNIEASLLRDITLTNGHRLEVWELDRLTVNDDLLHSQARTLTTSMEL